MHSHHIFFSFFYCVGSIYVILLAMSSNFLGTSDVSDEKEGG